MYTSIIEYVPYFITTVDNGRLLYTELYTAVIVKRDIFVGDHVHYICIWFFSVLGRYVVADGFARSVYRYVYVRPGFVSPPRPPTLQSFYRTFRATSGRGQFNNSRHRRRSWSEHVVRVGRCRLADFSLLINHRR